MGTYADAYKEASRKEGTKEIGVTYFKFEEVGKHIVGVYVGFNPVPGQYQGQEYNQYLFETDDGPIKFHLGAAADRDYAPLLVIGEIYMVRYDGKQDIGKGQQVNRFHVEHIDKSFLPVPNAGA